MEAVRRDTWRVADRKKQQLMGRFQESCSITFSVSHFSRVSLTVITLVLGFFTLYLYVTESRSTVSSLDCDHVYASLSLQTCYNSVHLPLSNYMNAYWAVWCAKVKRCVFYAPTSLDSGLLDDHLTLPIPSSECALGFLRLFSWIGST
jgi:hypothetical protein